MDDTLRNGILSVISNYSKYTGLPLQFFPAYTLENIEINVESNCNLCRLIQNDKKGKEACCNQRLNAVKASFSEYNYQIVLCHAGLCEWIVPVFYKGEAVGYFVSGFVFLEGDKSTNIEKQANIYAKQFHFKTEIAEEALTTQMGIVREEVEPMAQLLFALTKLNIPPGLKSMEERIKDLDVASHFVALEKEKAKDDNETAIDHSLYYYICKDNTDKKKMIAFWKNVESKASTIFMNIMGGRYAEAYEQYDEVMQMAYMEDTTTYAKISAEMLFHVIYLKFYTDDLYDIRFYRLTFETCEGLQKAQSIHEVKEVMTESFKKMYLFYNVESVGEEQKAVSRQIIEYLESNYSEDLHIKDIEKIVYMSSAYASKLFKKETSVTIKNCLVQIRMRHAQELITKTDMPIKDVAAAVGYSDIRGFYKMFAKHFGITCSEMRDNK